MGKGGSKSDPVVIGHSSSWPGREVSTEARRDQSQRALVLHGLLGMAELEC